jgi:hypothetical protein
MKLVVKALSNNDVKKAINKQITCVLTMRSVLPTLDSMFPA